MAQTGEFGMKAPRILLILALSALLIESLSAIGWWQVEKTRQQLEVDPTAAAGRILSSTLFNLPSAVIRSRRLDLSYLGDIPRETVIAVLKALSARQRKTIPADPRGWFNAGRLELIRGDLKEGRRDLEAALLRDPTNPFILRLLALTRRAQGDLGAGLQLLAQAEAYAPGFRQPPIDLIPEDEETVLLKGAELRLKVYPRLRVENTLHLEQLLRSMGRVDEAAKLLESLAGHPRADLLRGRLALSDGRLEEAKTLARKVAGRRSFPSQIRASAMALLAEALAEDHDMKGAVAAAGRARFLAPEVSDPYRALARISERRGDFEDALAQLRRAWGMDPTNISILRDLARVAEKTGQIAEARLALERIVKLLPDDPRPAQHLVDFLLRNGEYMDAAMALSAALDRNPTDAGLLQRAEKLHREVVGGRR